MDQKTIDQYHDLGFESGSPFYAEDRVSLSSIAISLKRIADQLENLNKSKSVTEHGIVDKLGDIESQLKAANSHQATLNNIVKNLR